MMWIVWFIGFVVGLIPAFSGVYNGATMFGIGLMAFATSYLVRKAIRGEMGNE